MRLTYIKRQYLYAVELLLTEKEIIDIASAGTIYDGDAIQELLKVFRETENEIQNLAVDERNGEA